MTPPGGNRRETGARKLEEHPEIDTPNPVHTGDEGDEPELPYGLTEPVDDRGSATRHHDGTQPHGRQPHAEEVDEKTPAHERRPL